MDFRPFTNRFNALKNERWFKTAMGSILLLVWLWTAITLAKYLAQITGFNQLKGYWLASFEFLTNTIRTAGAVAITVVFFHTIKERPALTRWWFAANFVVLLFAAVGLALSSIILPVIIAAALYFAVTGTVAIMVTLFVIGMIVLLEEVPTIGIMLKKRLSK